MVMSHCSTKKKNQIKRKETLEEKRGEEGEKELEQEQSTNDSDNSKG